MRVEAPAADDPAERGHVPLRPRPHAARDERRGFERSQRTSAASTSPASTDTATQIPVQTQTAGAPGAGLTSILPHGGSFMWAIRDKAAQARLPLQRPAARLLDPGAVRRVRAALARPARPARGQRRGRAAGRHRPQRPPRLGLHLRPLRQRRPLRREAHRARHVQFHGKERKLDCRDEVFTYNTPATDLPDLITVARARRRARSPSGSAAPSTARSSTRATASSSARRFAAWKRELETIVGPLAAQRREHGQGGRHGDAARDLERERDRRRRPRQHRLLAPGPAPAAAEALGRAPALSRRRPRRVDRLPAARRQPARDRPEAGLAHELEQPAVGRLDQRRLRGARAPRRARFTASASCRSWCRRSRGTRATSARPRSSRPRARTPSSSRSSNRKRLQPGQAAREGARAGRRSARCWRWDGDYAETDAAGTVDPGVAIWEEFKDRSSRRS